MPESPHDQVVWHTLQSVDYTLADLSAALVLLHNVSVIDDNELKRLAEKAGRMFPCQPTEDERAAERAGGWVHEDFDEWSELTKERDGARADAEADSRRQDLWGY